jgi:hypothetical protein
MSNTDNPSETPLQFQSITNRSESPKLTRTHTNGSNARRPSIAASNLHRSTTNSSHKESRDPNLDVNLPYRTFSNGANLAEYTEESKEGEIDAGVIGNDKKQYKLVTFTPNDPANPKNWSKAYKWYCTMVVAITCFVVAFSSAVITADIVGVEKSFNVSEELALASVSLFVVGFGVGK